MPHFNMEHKMDCKTKVNTSAHYHIITIFISTSWRLTASRDVPRLNCCLTEATYNKRKRKNSVCLYCHYQQLSEQVVNKARSGEM